jgi:hypothetical protein
MRHSSQWRQSETFLNEQSKTGEETNLNNFLSIRKSLLVVLFVFARSPQKPQRHESRKRTSILVVYNHDHFVQAARRSRLKKKVDKRTPMLINFFFEPTSPHCSIEQTKQPYCEASFEPCLDESRTTQTKSSFHLFSHGSGHSICSDGFEFKTL